MVVNSVTQLSFIQTWTPTTGKR